MVVESKGVLIGAVVDLSLEEAMVNSRLEEEVVAVTENRGHGRRRSQASKT